MLKKIFQSPILLILIGLGNFVWSLIDYLGRTSNSEDSYLIAIFVPIAVYSVWALWVAINAKDDLTFVAQKLKAPVTIFFVTICFILVIVQNTLPSPFREITRYALYCLISGSVVSLGLIKYFELKRSMS